MAENEGLDGDTVVAVVVKPKNFAAIGAVIQHYSSSGAAAKWVG
jgi:hypothetical protein